MTRELDNDGIGNACDNCLFNPNPSQINSDGDAFGDICDNDDDNDEFSKYSYQTTHTLTDKATQCNPTCSFFKENCNALCLPLWIKCMYSTRIFVL